MSEPARSTRETMTCQHCGERIEWCSRALCVRITTHLIHSATGIGACRGNQTTALADVPRT